MLIDLLGIAVGLSMDAFAVAMCKGLAVCKVKIKHMLLAGLWFGGFQGLMPLLGYIFGNAFLRYIEAFDHWIAFALLAFIGGKMLLESFDKEECNDSDASFAFATMAIMAVATSIDALAAGISLVAQKENYPGFNILIAVALIGVVTFIFSFIGVKIGSVFGAKYKSKAEFAGGVVLVLMGIKILLQHLFGI